MNLENLNLLELNVQETIEINGGLTEPMGFWDYVEAYHNLNVSIWTIGLETLRELSVAYGSYLHQHQLANGGN